MLFLSFFVLRAATAATPQWLDGKRCNMTFGPRKKDRRVYLQWCSLDESLYPALAGSKVRVVSRAYLPIIVLGAIELVPVV